MIVSFVKDSLNEAVSFQHILRTKVREKTKVCVSVGLRASLWTIFCVDSREMRRVSSPENL